MNSITPGQKPKWHRVEAGYYVRHIGLHKTLEIVHKDDTPADKLHLDRWVVRVVTRRKPTVEMGRFSSYREARTYGESIQEAINHDVSAG